MSTDESKHYLAELLRDYEAKVARESAYYSQLAWRVGGMMEATLVALGALQSGANVKNLFLHAPSKFLWMDISYEEPYSHCMARLSRDYLQKSLDKPASH